MECDRNGIVGHESDLNPSDLGKDGQRASCHARRSWLSCTGGGLSNPFGSSPREQQARTPRGQEDSRRCNEADGSAPSTLTA